MGDLKVKMLPRQTLFHLAILTAFVAGMLPIKGQGPIEGSQMVAGKALPHLSNFHQVETQTAAEVCPIADPELDLTFGTNGCVTTDFNAGPAFGRDVALQQDGKIVVAGEVNNSFSDTDFALVRYNADGSLDNTFGGDGRVTTSFGTARDRAGAVAIQADGKIVAAGATEGSGSMLAVARYNSDGSLDTSYGSGGKVIAEFDGQAGINTIAFQADGKMVVAGSTSSYGDSDIVIVRYNSEGSLDNSFSSDGKTTISFGSGYDAAYDLAIQSDKKIVVIGTGGTLESDFAVVRLKADGELDGSFGNGGKVTTDFGSITEVAYSGAIQEDGKIVVAGRSYNNPLLSTFTLARYNVDGSLDTTFDSDGKVITSLTSRFDGAWAVALQSNGKIVVSGSASDDIGVVRYLSDGSLDPTFSEDGIKIVDIASSYDDAYSVAIQPDGKILVSGKSDVDGKWVFSLIRFPGDQEDTTPPAWKSSRGIQEAFQVGDGTVRLYWNAATDPESPPVSYKLYQSHDSQTYEFPIYCNPSPFSPYDCYDDFPGLDPAVDDPSFSFSVSAINAADRETSDNPSQTVTLYNFKTLAEIDEALAGKDADPEALVDEGLFVIEALPQNYLRSTWVVAILDVLYFLEEIYAVLHIGKAVVEKSVMLFFSATTQTVTAHYLVEITKQRLTWQMLASISSPSTSRTTILASMIDKDNILPTGSPLFITGQIVRRAIRGDAQYVFKPAAKNLANHQKENWERYSDFLPLDYDLENLTTIRELLCEEKPPGGSFSESRAIMAQVEDRWREGDHLYLKLVDWPNRDCKWSWVPRERIIVRLPYAEGGDYPAPWSTIGVYGTLTFQGNDTGGMRREGSFVLDTAGASGGEITLLSGILFPLVTELEKRPPDFEEFTYAVAASPVDFHLYDTAGNHFGMVYGTGGEVLGINRGIADVAYFGYEAVPEVLVFSGSAEDGYTLGFQGTGSGTADLAISFSSDGGRYRHELSYINVPVSASTVAEIALSDGTDARLYVDSDGNGSYDLQIEPNNHIVHGQHTIFLPLLSGGSSSALNQPPNMVSNPSPAHIAAGQSVATNLHWTGGDPDGGRVTYDVYFDAGNSGPDILICDDAPQAFCALPMLQSHTSYSWQIETEDPYGEKITGPVWQFSTGELPNQPPFEPNNSSPTDGAGDVGTMVDLIWTGGDPEGDNVTYDVYLAAGDDTPDVLVCDEVSTSSCDPGTLEFETRYYWRVVATDEHGATMEGLVWQFTTQPLPNDPPHVPSGPSPATGDTGVNVDADLSWSGGDPNGDIVTYTVFLEVNDSDPNIPVLACAGITISSCDPGTLHYGQHYYWRIYAVDEHGAITMGPVWDFTTNYLPLVPSDPSPPAQASGQDIDILLSWSSGDPDGDQVTYDVRFAADNIALGTLICDDVAFTSCDPGTLKYDTHYYWVVGATDEQGALTVGPEWDFTTKPGYQLAAEIVEPEGYGVSTRSVAEKDGYAFLLASDHLFYTYDVSNLPGQTSFTTYMTPVLTQTLTIGTGLLRNGDYLYAFGANGLQILDISDASAPSLLGGRNDLHIYNMTLHANNLVAVGSDGIVVYSVTDPEDPVLVSAASSQDLGLEGRNWFSAAVYSDTLHAAEFISGDSSSYGIRVFDFSNPTTLTHTQFISRTSLAYHLLALDDQMMECTNAYVGLWSLTQPGSPIFLDSNTASARVCAQDGANVVANGQVIWREVNLLETVQDFDPGFSHLSGLPYGSAVNSQFVFIAQDQRILVLKKPNP